MRNKPKELDDEIAKDLKTVVEHFDREDRDVREDQLRNSRKLKMYWNNLNRIYWSETARDYRVASNLDALGQDLQQAYYDRPINVFRAFLETIIAALSVQVPSVRCVPGDADNPLDLTTAKGGNIISEQVYKHNNVILLWLQALYIYCTEGLIAFYSYTREDAKYGTYEEKSYKDVEEEGYVCPSCQATLTDEAFELAMQDKFDPNAADVELFDAFNDLGPVCPECGVLLDENLQKSKVIVSRLVGSKTKPKGRVCIDVYGGLYIKIANYAKAQADTPYLIFSHDTHYANVVEVYPHLYGKFSSGGTPNTGGISGYDSYDSNYRQNIEYRGSVPENQVTVKECWLRPAAFNILPQEKSDALKKKFPFGCRVVFVNEFCADYCPESLDDHWTLTKNPTSDYLTHEPLGELLTNIQDIVNDLISLTLQTIEHQVTQTWADPAVVDFNGQRQLESNPGMLTATKTQGGKNISDAFFTTQAASLSPEVFKFYEIIQSLGQFVSGAMPSIFGGTQGKGSSGTASEYAMQKSMALQRLNTPWKMLTIAWKELFGKVIPAYIDCLKEDERIVSKDPQSGNYMNTFIRKIDLAGRIGDIELEHSEQMPITDDQKADVVMRLMELNNAEILQMFTIPENLPFVRKVVKLPEFTLPGEDDRNKQYDEINKMLNGEMVEIEPTIDNNMIHVTICRSWAVSETGRLAKENNPVGYMLVLEHLAAHEMIIQQQMIEQALLSMQPQDDGQSGPNKLPKGKTEIKGERDARTPVGE